MVTATLQNDKFRGRPDEGRTAGGRAEQEGDVAPRKWAEMTWEEVRELDGSRAVALLPVGAIEAHGPHLPLGTDVVIAEAMAEAAAARLEDAGRIPLLLPAISYTAAPFGGGFP